MKHFIIPEKDLFSIIQYLQTKPMAEVENIVMYLRKLQELSPLNEELKPKLME